MDDTQAVEMPDRVPGVDDSIQTLCFGLWQIIQFTNGAYAALGNEFAQALADRLMNTEYPIDDDTRCQYLMIKELTVMITRRSNRQ